MNRLIPDFSKDKAVNSLSWFAEICFRRLWNKADDFGRYYADEVILKAELFPRKEIRTPDLRRALQECERAALLVQYTVDGERFIQLNNFNQRVRASKSKFPEPQKENDGQMTDTCQTNDGQMSDKCQTNVRQLSDTCTQEKEKEKVPPHTPLYREKDREKEKVEKEIFDFLPEAFSESSDFREVWNEWIQYRRQRKLGAWVEATLKQRAKTFAAWGVAETVQNIRFSISQGYQGIFQDRTQEAAREQSQQELTLWELKAAYKHKINFYDPMHCSTESQIKALKSQDLESFKRYVGFEYETVMEIARKQKQKGKF